MVIAGMQEDIKKSIDFFKPRGIILHMNNQPKPVKLSNLREGDPITLYNYLPTGNPAIGAGKPLVVKAITLPFIYTKNDDVIDTRVHSIIRITKKAL